ncbi:putative alcohol zinc [Diaporthe ampelina]|uniref:Putative alcohol zinc n=1 Tax=Diaporthe ampelina TaxID=1214573 RepID=A0A0G2FY26_9PEZI|nr:putative alcohol zinc [Diaporthe ampelina]
MSPTQKALVVTEIGKPVKLVDDQPIPEPSAKQIQLKVKIAGINPHDHKARDHGLFIANSLPSILANDVVGTVTKVGEGVSGVAVGDRVVTHPGFKHGSVQNGLQEYAVADAGAFAKIPDGTSDDEAATLPTNIIAPLVALFKELRIPAPWSPEAQGFDYGGVTLLVIGGGSNCGRFGVQLAKLAGIGRIVVVGGGEAELKGLGATHVLDRHGGDDAVLARIRDVVGDDLVYAYDAVNDVEHQVLGLNALSSTKKGTLARLLPLGPVDESKVVGKKAGFEVRDTYGSSQGHPELAPDFWERLPGFLEAGEIKPTAYVVKQGLTADNVNEVLDAYRDGKPVKKTHIHI